MDVSRETRDELGAEPGYVWHFKLAQEPAGGPDTDRLTAMVRTHLAALLRCVILTDHGTDLRVSGFRFLNEPGVEHDVYQFDADRDSPLEGD